MKLNKRLDDLWVYPKLSKKDRLDVPTTEYFKFLNEKSANDPLNLYIHIPFCKSTCWFCPYYKRKDYQDKLDEYVDNLIKELSLYASTNYLNGHRISSIHFGGGDPLLMNTRQFNRIMKAITKSFKFEPDGNNTTIEGAFSSIQSKEQLDALVQMGLTRLSLGIQTFNENIRNRMKMYTTLEDVYRGHDIISSSTLKQYCFDLMYNMPDQTNEIFISDLEKADQLDPYHVDIYNMALFPNTSLYRSVMKGDFSLLPSDARNIEMYNIGRQWLAEHGYRLIITSTFSKYQTEPHFEDLLYLKGHNVLGIGASSKSYIDGYSFKNFVSLEDYNQAIVNDFAIEIAQRPEVSLLDRQMVFFPILTCIEVDKYQNDSYYSKKVNQLIEEGFAYVDGAYLRLTDKGIVYSGNICDFLMAPKRRQEYFSLFAQAVRDGTNPYNEDYMGV